MLDKKTNGGNIYGYDNQSKHIIAARKNAKIAGINKEICYNIIDVGWPESRFNKESIDIVATYLPVVSKHVSEIKIKKLYIEFFRQCNIILKRNGKIGIVVERKELLKEEAEAAGFKIQKEKRVMQGEKELFLLSIEK